MSSRSPAAPLDTLTDSPPTAPAPRRLGISATQVAGSALAAVSAAFAASYLGVAGTVIGAALGSIVATVGTATYTASLQRGGQVVRRTVRTGPSVGASAPRVRPPAPERTRSLPALPWPRLALAAAAVLAITLGTLTAVEQLTGQPVSTLTAGGSAGGTTLGKVTGAGKPVVSQPTGSRAPTDATSTDPTPSNDPIPVLPGGLPEGSPTTDPTPDPSPAPTEPTEPTAPTDGSSTNPDAGG